MKQIALPIHRDNPGFVVLNLLLDVNFVLRTVTVAVHADGADNILASRANTEWNILSSLEMNRLQNHFAFGPNGI